MSEVVRGKIDTALDAQNYVLRAWEDLSTRDYSRIMRKYVHLGDALNALRDTVDAANKAIVTDAFAPDIPQDVVTVPPRFYTLPKGYGFRLPVSHADEHGDRRWREIVIEANVCLYTESGGIVFYFASEEGLHTVVSYPQGWYGGPVRPVELSTDQRMESHGHTKPKRKKLSEMTDEEHSQAIVSMRQRLSQAEKDRALRKAPQNVGPERDEIRSGLARGEFPTDDLGTDSAGAPIVPPQRLKDVWGKEKPPQDPPELPVTDDEHEATLKRLREESDRVNFGEPQPANPDIEYGSGVNTTTPVPKAVQINADGTIPQSQAFQPRNSPLPSGVQEYADKAQRFVGTTPVDDVDPSDFGPPDEHGKVWPRKADRLEGIDPQDPF